jgi:hypothetical protein
MKVAVCVRCGKSWSVLQDGTLVEHPQQDTPAILCSGSRTKPGPGDKDQYRTNPTTGNVPRHGKPVPSAN